MDEVFNNISMLDNIDNKNYSGMSDELRYFPFFQVSFQKCVLYEMPFTPLHIFHQFQP